MVARRITRTVRVTRRITYRPPTISYRCTVCQYPHVVVGTSYTPGLTKCKRCGNTFHVS